MSQLLITIEPLIFIPVQFADFYDKDLHRLLAERLNSLTEEEVDAITSVNCHRAVFGLN